MNRLHLTLFLLLPTYIHAQAPVNQDSLAKQFLSDIFPGLSKQHIYIRQSLDSFQVAEVKERMGTGSYIRRVIMEDRTERTDTLNLTPDELRQIGYALLDNDTGKNWLRYGNNIVTVIPNDTLKEIFLQQDPHNSFARRYGQKLYTLTQPVFFRDNTLCFMFYDYFCGSLCAATRCAVYKKVQGRWRNFWTIIMADS